MNNAVQTGRTGRLTTSIAQDFTDFQNIVSASFVPLHVTSDDPGAFWGRIRACTVDDVHVTEINAGQHVVERTPALIAREDRRYYKLNLQLAGTGLLIQDNREAVLQPGDLAIYDTERPYTLVFDKGFRNMVVMFPRHLLDLPVATVGQLTAVRMPGTQGLGNVIAPFLARLVENLDQLGGATGARLAHNAVDLVSTMFASELDLERTARDPHHALMQQIRGYIDANLMAPDLGPGQIAAAHYISTRHLHALFREQGCTVSGWIRSRRLERCRRDLLDPLSAARPIAAIAARWGFVDAAHFSRVFKSAFGRSPSDVRMSAQP
ncbi:MAG: helix-turn-helix domain-containing protein [Pseudonocardia sp.]